MPRRNGRINYSQIIADKVFSGDKEKYENLSLTQKNRLLRAYELQFPKDSSSLVLKKVYPGTLEEFAHLSDSEQEDILKLYDDMNEYYNFKNEVPIYTGSLKEFKELSSDRKDYLKDVALANKALQAIENAFQEMKSCKDERRFNSLSSFNEGYVSCLRKVKERTIENNHFSPDEFENLINVDISTNIKKPKFGFLEQKKYKVLNNMLTDDYILKLKTRQIDSDFQQKEDYDDKSKWKEFIDKKESDYKKVVTLGYTGTFEDFLQEKTIVTLEYLKFGYSKTKERELATQVKENFQQPEEKVIRQHEGITIEELRKREEERMRKSLDSSAKQAEILEQANSELNDIMNSEAARKLNSYAVSSIRNIVFNEDPIIKPSESQKPKEDTTKDEEIKRKISEAQQRSYNELSTSMNNDVAKQSSNYSVESSSNERMSPAEVDAILRRNAAKR